MTRRLRRLPAVVRHELLSASALSQPALDLLDGEAMARADADGVVTVDAQGLVRFVHPLLAASVYGSSTREQRRKVHRDLAGRVSSSEERARHLALAADGPDEVVAVELTAAAQAARDRGAPDAAIELLELASDLTPPDDPAILYARRLELGALLSEAGDPERAATVLRDVADHAPSGAERAKALLLLAYRSETSEAGRAPGLCADALEAAGDDAALRVEILAAASRMSDEDVEQKVRFARDALEAAREDGVNPALRAWALLAHAEAEFFAGRGIDSEAFARAAELEATAIRVEDDKRSRHRIHHHGHVRPSARLLGILRIYADELDDAREEFEYERTVASDHGDEVQLARTLIRLGVIETRTGRWDAAEHHLEDAARILERTRQDWLRCWLLAIGATLETLRGRVDEARAAGEEGRALASAIGSTWFVADCQAALGFLDLTLGELAPAREHFDAAAEIEARIGSGEPRLVRSHADRIEALIGLGELEAAAEALAQLDAHPSSWASAVGGRSRGLLHLAGGELDEALLALEQALIEHERLPIPFELARTLLVKGQTHRRRNERRLARESLERCFTILEELGAPIWLERARAELRRLGLRRGAGDALTPAEENVAALAASGLTNREIAERIFVSPKTVEATLARVYRKFGIRSRAELGARMAARETSTAT
jgi:DNA-binding CsgD family transcriptional regulator